MPAQAISRLLLVTAGGIYALKVASLVGRRRPKGAGLAVFLLAWPGVVADQFVKRGGPLRIDPVKFLKAWTRMAAGAISMIVLAVYADRIPDAILGMTGVGAVLLTIHIGACDLLPWLLRWAGFDVPLLFDRPWASRSLSEFWSRRWNLVFVEMNQRLFLRPVHHLFGRAGSRFALFALSGLLHELAISFPAGGGWGLPSAYFLLQGGLVAVEKRLRIANRGWTWFWLLGPAPWLFHERFRHEVIVPFYHWLHMLIAQRSYEQYLSMALYAAAIGHLTVLIASFQAPIRLGWKEDIAKLMRFNQRIFWMYSLYILLCIVSFAALTWRLHDSFLAADLAARWLAGFIAVFWTVRVVADIFWYRPLDWPPGNALVAGHALLTTLFVSLATVYWFAAIAPPKPAQF